MEFCNFAAPQKYRLGNSDTADVVLPHKYGRRRGYMEPDIPTLVSRTYHRLSCGRLQHPPPLPIQPPHSIHRHYDHRGMAGVDRLDDVASVELLHQYPQS